MVVSIIDETTYTTRQSSNSENEVELSMAAVVYDVLGGGHVRLVELEEGGTMQNGEERCPLLEKDADQLVGFQSCWYLPDDGV